MRLSLLISVGFSLTACDNEASKDESKRMSKEDPSGSMVNVSTDPPHGQPFVTDDQGIEGRKLAIQHCQRCHLFAEPEVLPKDIWRDSVLPRMGALMGMHHAGVDVSMDQPRNQSEKQAREGAGIYPPTAAMTRKDWQTLTDYLLKHAPDMLEKPESLDPIAPRSELFREAPFGYKQDNPNTTMVRIDEHNRRLFVGDETMKQLSILNSDLERIQKIGMKSAPVHVQVVDGDLWVTNIGFLNPTDLPEGELLVLREQDGWFQSTGEPKISGLRRPTHASYEDLNNNGLTDIVISEYGHRLGALTYYQAKENGSYQKRVLMPEPGSMISHIRDLNKDGLPDVAVITGQGREGVHIHYNNGDGTFTYSYTLPLPPYYGSSSFAFYDFNDDGHLDILATNGDNGDHQAILKPHHGIRIYLNNGDNSFHEHYFFPMNGAYKALAADFDLDGDLDIVAISMFADLDDRPEEGFVYLENMGEGNFRASTIPSVKNGRWMCMDIGDLDGDGDKDIVLGSFIRGPSEVPASYLESWEEGMMPGLVLWNKTIDSSSSARNQGANPVEDEATGQSVKKPQNHYDLGMLRHKQGRESEAIKHLSKAVQLNPDDPEARHGYGKALYGKGETEDAIAQFRQALKLQPSHANAHSSLGVALLQRKELDEAIASFHQALRIDSDLAAARYNLEHSLQTLATELMGQPFSIQDGHPDRATMHAALGNELRSKNDIAGAVRHYQWALSLNSDLLPALNNLAWIRATHPNPEFRDGAQAVLLAEHCCKLTDFQLNGTLDTLAAAYAEVGRFDDAIRLQTKAVVIAEEADKPEQKERLETYQAGKPFRE